MLVTVQSAISSVEIIDLKYRKNFSYVVKLKALNNVGRSYTKLNFDQWGFKLCVNPQAGRLR
jgi:hypothetical protein